MGPSSFWYGVIGLPANVSQTLEDIPVPVFIDLNSGAAGVAELPGAAVTGFSDRGAVYKCFDLLTYLPSTIVIVLDGHRNPPKDRGTYPGAYVGFSRFRAQHKQRPCRRWDGRPDRVKTKIFSKRTFEPDGQM